MTEFHNYDWISQAWLNFTSMTESHNCDWISQLWLDFTSMTEFHILNWISHCQLNFTISTEFPNFNWIWWLNGLRWYISIFDGLVDVFEVWQHRCFLKYVDGWSFHLSKRWLRASGEYLRNIWNGEPGLFKSRCNWDPIWTITMIAIC